jgi:chromate transporter
VTTGDQSDVAPRQPGGASADQRDVRTVPMATFLRYFLGLGIWGFGGPIATVGYMQRDLVERRALLSSRDFVDVSLSDRPCPDHWRRR